METHYTIIFIILAAITWLSYKRCIDIWGIQVTCPECTSNDVEMLTFIDGGTIRYRCNTCGKYFELKEPTNE